MKTEDKGLMVLNNRMPEAEVNPIFPGRWSPRAFDPKPIPVATLRSLFEAAKWAPSCYNEQPWLFLHSTTEAERLEYLSILVKKNQEWAKNAPVLAFLFARRSFAMNGKPNRWAVFDCGAAWMSLALQARMLGLYAHAMAGYDPERAYGVLRVQKEEYEIICAIAIGGYGSRADLPEDFLAMEAPNDRKPLAEVAGKIDLVPGA